MASLNTIGGATKFNFADTKSGWYSYPQLDWWVREP